MSDQGKPDVAPSPRVPSPRDTRRSVELSGFAVLEDRSTHPITVLDLSYDGCGIETPVALNPGDAIRLSVSRRGAIDAEVRWFSEGKAGLVFKPEKEPPPDDQGQTIRSATRIPLKLVAAIKRRDRPNYQAEVSDVSPTGFRFEFVDKPVVGETVLVRFDGLQSLEAIVRWVAGPEAGVQFDRTIHPAVFALLLQRLESRS